MERNELSQVCDFNKPNWLSVFIIHDEIRDNMENILSYIIHRIYNNYIKQMKHESLKS